MDILTDKLLLKDLKVVYLSDLNSIKLINILLSPNWFSLIVVVSGSIHFTQGTTSVNVCAREVYVIPNGAQASAISLSLRICLLSCTIDFAVRSRVIRFGIGYMEALTNQRSFIFSLTQIEVRGMVSLLGLLQKNISKKHTIFKDQMVLLCFSMILYEYIELRYKYGYNIARLEYRSEKIVMSFITLVQQHCAAHHNVKFYADCLYVSSGHLGKAVRSVLRMSAKHFIEMVIVSEAYILLADPALSITEIAELLYFDSSSSFSGFFKKYSKLTPSQYRQSLKS